MSALDTRDAILFPIRATERHIDDDALDLAVAATSGYPFLIQLVGYHIWRVDPDAHTITSDHVRTALPAVEERLDRLVIEPALARLSERDRAFLDAMAEDDGPSRMRDVAERMSASGNYANQYRRRLLDAELIADVGRGRVDIQLPGARDYLRDHPSI